MSNYYRAYAVTTSCDLRALQAAGDPDVQFEIIKAGNLREQFVYRLLTPASSCVANELQFVRVGDASFFFYQTGGHIDHACIDEGLALLTPRDYDGVLIPLPSRANEIAPLLLLRPIEKPIEQADFYGFPVDMAGEVDGKPWHLWRYK